MSGTKAVKEKRVLGRAQFWILMSVAMAGVIIWSSYGPLRPSVRLLTGPGHGSSGTGSNEMVGLNETVGCYTNFAVGQLVEDAASGTAIVEMGRRTPVMWPAGYTGRRSVWEVEVADTWGRVVARTGTRVQIEGGYTGGAFLACGYVLSR
jgi:hypothetical protein